ncbi:MAG: hypothetical protein MUE73_07650 [Planctomycetes bacterium]|jgi:hypothetical protein|nr:hypothetical protein [Planctomycetota bacterium]
MKPVCAACACALVLLLASTPAASQDHVWIVQHVRDRPLAEVANQIALTGGVQVKVEKELGGKKITLLIDAELDDALQQVAKAAGAHLIKTGPKTYEIRSTPPPADGAKSTPEAAAEPAIPEWARPMAEKLSTAKVEYLWQGEPLPKILEWLSRQTGLSIRLDPRVLKERSRDALEIHICSMDENMKPLPIEGTAESALSSACGYPGADLQWVWRFHGIWVSTREHVQALSPEVVPPVGAAAVDAAGELRKKVDATRITLTLKGAKLDKAIEAIAKKGGVKIVLDRALAKEFANDPVDLDATEMPLADALGLVLLPRGLVLEFKEKSLVIRRSKG